MLFSSTKGALTVLNNIPSTVSLEQLLYALPKLWRLFYTMLIINNNPDKNLEAVLEKSVQIRMNSRFSFFVRSTSVPQSKAEFLFSPACLPGETWPKVVEWEDDINIEMIYFWSGW